MIFVVECLAASGVYCIFRMFGDSFACGWVGGVTCGILFHLAFQVPA